METEYYVQCENNLWLAVEAKDEDEAKEKVKEFNPTGKVTTK